MSDTKTKETTPDILDDVKRVERAVKAKLLMNAISEIKERAREILELKEETTMILEEIGIDEKDIKRIIDFINNSVSLTQSDKDKIRQSIKNEKEKDSEKIEKEIISSPYFSQPLAYNMHAFSNTAGVNTVGLADSFTLTSSLGATSNAGGNSLEIKL